MRSYRIKDTNKNIKLGIGFPCSYEFVPFNFFQSMMFMKKPDYEFIAAKHGNVDVMRNYMVREARQAECTHLIMLDTDMVYHEDTIFKLLSYNLPIVGALCFRRGEPFNPLMLKGEPGNYQCIDEWTEDELVEVDATGTGCILFDMEVFRKMPSPWFKFKIQKNGKPLGEDIGFCHELRKAGYTIYVDTSIPTKHLTTMEITRETYILYKALRARQDRKKMQG